MKIQLVGIALFNLFTFSCSNATSEKPIEQKATVDLVEHSTDEVSNAIALNNGEKWKVVPDMLLHIRNMESDVVTFTKDEQKDYKSLSTKLLGNIDLLTNNCTMEGKAHDELHKWLLPYIDLVNELSEAKGETEAAKLFNNIQTSFKAFNQFFQ